MAGEAADGRIESGQVTIDENGNDRTKTSELPPTQTQEHAPSHGAAGVPKRIGQYSIKRASASGGRHLPHRR